MLNRLNRLRRRVAERRAWLHRRRCERLDAQKLRDFLDLASQTFVHLQAAWDRADLEVLRSMTTEPLLEELRDQLVERGPGPNRTEVLSLKARLLELEELREAYIASVEFSGLIREQLGTSAEPFRELWLLANLKSGSQGWQLARVQSLS